MPTGSAASGLTAVPEPSGCWLLAVAALIGDFGRKRRSLTRHAALRFGLMLGRSMLALLIVVVTLRAANADLIGNSFNINPLWQGNDNILPQGDPNKARDDFNNFGYSSVTKNALGATGELGG